MRRLLSALLLISLVAITGCETRSAKAVKYNDTILAHQAEISEAFTSLDSALNTYDAREMEYAKKILDAEIITGQRLLDTLNTFRGDSTMLKASRELFNFYELVAEERYPQLIEILLIPDSVYTHEDERKAYALDSTIRLEFQNAHDQFAEQQQIFWDKYNIIAADED